MRRPLIGLVGLKGAGKDSAAKTLIADFGYKRVAFADELKAEVYVTFANRYMYLSGILPATLPRWIAFIDEVKYDEPLSEYGWIRPMLQHWGVWKRSLDEDYWVKKVAPKFGPGVAVTDVRFHNEAKAIKDAGGILVRVVRPDQVLADAHVSETEQLEIACDKVIVNNGTLAQLRTSVHILMAGFEYGGYEAQPDPRLEGQLELVP